MAYVSANKFLNCCLSNRINLLVRQWKGGAFGCKQLLVCLISMTI